MVAAVGDNHYVNQQYQRMIQYQLIDSKIEKNAVEVVCDYDDKDHCFHDYIHPIDEYLLENVGTSANGADR